MRTRVVLADDQDLVRAGLRLILDAEPDITVVGEAADGRAAVAAARALRPDVVLMDIRMPVLDGIEATRQLAGDGLSSTSVLILTTYDADEYVFTALRAGASGFLLKHASPEELVRAIHTVAAGEGLIAPAVTRRLIEEFAARSAQVLRPPESLGALTRREREVLELIGRGLTNGEIADALFLGEATVKTHVAHIMRTLGLRDRVQIVIYAYEAGVVRPGSERRA
jgi:DNA-binding NarL/FixJ family response regulator